MAGGTSVPFRWGILGAARIAGNRMIPALRARGYEVAAVAASSSVRADEYARKHTIPIAYGSYEALLADPEIDAVYNALANGLHREWSIRAAEAGKHCLCEKPMALSPEEAAEMGSAFSRADKVLAEAFMWRHHPQVDWALGLLRDGRLGELRTISAHFAFRLDRPDDYRWRADQGGGALRDLGCYAVNAARLFFGSEPVEGSIQRSTAAPGGVDVTSSGVLRFPAGQILAFSCSFDSHPSQRLIISGTLGEIEFRHPWAKPETVAEATFLSTDGREDFSAQANSYERMADHFAAACSGSAAYPAEDGVLQAGAMALLTGASN